MINFAAAPPAFNPCCPAAFRLKIRLSELLGVPPWWTATGLRCSVATVERHRELFRQDLARHGVPFHASEPAHARLRALYRAEGGLGARTPEGWSAVLNEAHRDLVDRVIGAFHATLEERRGHEGTPLPRYTLSPRMIAEAWEALRRDADATTDGAPWPPSCACAPRDARAPSRGGGPAPMRPPPPSALPPGSPSSAFGPPPGSPAR